MVITIFYCRFAADFLKKEANGKRTAIPNIPSLLRWFQDDDPGQDVVGCHPHQACHHLPGAQALFLSRFYQYECQERRQGRLRFQGNSEQIRL